MAHEACEVALYRVLAVPATAWSSSLLGPVQGLFGPSGTVQKNFTKRAKIFA
jgi:hypothetical protein